MRAIPPLQSFKLFCSLVWKRIQASSTIFRIVFGYIQCITIVLRFNNVAWPSVFVSYLRGLEYFTIDIFTMLPIACITKSHVGFATELNIAVGLPIFTLFILFVLTLFIAPIAGHSHSLKSFGHMLNALLHRAELWDLIIFFFLFEYPVVCRKSLSAFDCVELALATPPISGAREQDERIRWATLMALTLLQNNREALDELAQLFEGTAQDVGSCIRALEASADAEAPERR